MTIVIMSITRTFNQLRIYPTLSPIVVMLKTVINDLRAFLFTLLILIFFFGNALVILGIGIDPTTLMNPEEKAAYDLEMQNEEAEEEAESDRRYLKPKGGGGGGGGDDDD